MITLTSIPGSGTHFCKDYLLKDWRRCNQHPKPRQTERYGEKLFHFEHIFPHTLDDLCFDYPILLPMRHPRAVAQTWTNRGGNHGSAIRSDRSADSKIKGVNLLNLYRLLIDVVDKHDPYYLPVDSPIREQFLSEFNKAMGIQFETDWRIVRNGGCSKVEMESEDIEAIEELLTNPFFRRFGY